MIFEVTKAEIRSLDDSALRELVGRLCRAEADACGAGPAAVRYGGNQNAADDGVDVETNLKTQSRQGSCLPEGHTLFQVKKPSMPPAAIKREMCPHDKPRPVFDALAQEKGSYILVSSSDDLSFKMKNSRIAAMKAALGPFVENIHVDFYDLSSLVDWSNQYPAIVCWIKHTFGQEAMGWQPYGDWSRSGSHAGPYLKDKARLQTPGATALLSSEEGLRTIREILRQGGTSVRLIGLSGVGKTRFVQALFEETAEQNALPANSVLYLDRQDPVKIPPLEMLELLLRAGQRAFMVVDNCSAQEHRRLTGKCVQEGSVVSLLTVEYDVQDDEPEDSSVYRMLPSSEECIEQLLQQMFPKWSSGNCHRIARLAGGNARIAIVLAKAAQRERDLNALQDKELFHRLFWQKGQQDDELYRTAQVCSLVYSFSVDLKSEEGTREFACLTSLSGLDRQTLYRNVQKLQRKQLIQSRSVWRAVLPHALTNYLAKAALEEIPADELLDVMEASTPHMLRSFSKRLSYLHDSAQAQAIFRHWLAAPPLTEPCRWDSVCQYRLEDAAPVIPEEVLNYLDALCEGGSRPERLTECFERYMLQWTLIQIAYEPEYFDRSVALLAMTVQAGPGAAAGSELFQIAFSGTHAPLTQRLAAIRRLLLQPPAGDPELGVKYLRAAMCGGYNLSPSAASMRDFGTRRRDDGWCPRNRQEALNWYREVVAFVQKITPSLPEAIQGDIQHKLAESLRGLWACGLEDAVACCCRSMAGAGSWWQGWVGLGQIKEFDWENMEPQKRVLLSQLLDLTEPKDPGTRAICLLHTAVWELQVFFPTDESVFENQALEHEIQRLAGLLASQPEALERLLPLLRDSNANGLLFGRGLAKGETAPGAVWPVLARAMAGQRNTEIQHGYLSFHFDQNPSWVLETLSDAERAGMISQSVYLQGFLAGSSELLDHIADLLTSGKLRFSDIEWLQYQIGRFDILDEDLLRFLERIRALEGGSLKAVELLSGYHWAIRHQKPRKLSHELQAFARHAIVTYMQTETVGIQHFYEFAELAAYCFSCNVPEAESRNFFQAVPPFLEGLERTSDFKPVFLKKALIPIARAHTETFLEVAMENGTDTAFNKVLIGRWRRIPNILENLDADRVAAWADSTAKRLWLAGFCDAYYSDGSDRCKWSDLAMALLHTTDSPAVLEIFLQKISPDSWSGSRADVFRKRMALVQDLASEPGLAETVCATLPRLEAELQETQRLESYWEAEQQKMYQQFEF